MIAWGRLHSEGANGLHRGARRNLSHLVLLALQVGSGVNRNEVIIGGPRPFRAATLPVCAGSESTSAELTSERRAPRFQPAPRRPQRNPDAPGRMRVAATSETVRETDTGRPDPPAAGGVHAGPQHPAQPWRLRRGGR